MGSDVLTLDDPPVQKPPIIGTAIASYVFLFRNFGHAVKMGWPFLVFLILCASLQMSFSFFVHNNFDATFQFMSSDWFGLLFFLLNLWFGFFYLLFITAFCVGWMRAITRGVSDQNFCALKREGTLVFCCIAQLLGIYVATWIISSLIMFLAYGFFYILSQVLPVSVLTPLSFVFESTPMIIIAIFVLSLLPLIYLAPSFLYFPAKASGFVISSKLGRKYFRGLSLRFFASVCVALVPFAFAYLCYFVSLAGIASFFGAMDEGYQIFGFMLTVFVVIISFIIPPIFCGVLSGYYLWVKKHRIADKPVSSKAKSPFDDDAWDNVKIWEDFD